MRDLQAPFQVIYEGLPVKVTEHEVKGKRLFHIDYKGFKKPLTMTVAVRANKEKFWTSIPEGRQKEAEEIGKLIAEFIRSNK